MRAAAIDNAESLSESLLTGPMISIFIGPDRTKWTLHRRLLSFHSPFFSSSRSQTEDEKLEFLDDSPAGWSLFVKFLYQGSLPSLSQYATSTHKYDHGVACHKLYILASRFSMLQLQNLAMDRFRACLHTTHLVPDAEEIHEMYASSPKSSGMRKLMIRIAARQIMDPETERDVQAYHRCFEAEPEFAAELIKEIRNLSGGMLFEDPTGGKRCDFHEHAEGEDCNPLSREDLKNSEDLLLQESIPDVESISKRTPKKLKLKAPNSVSEKTLDSFTPVRSNTTPISNIKQPFQRMSISSIKLNGVGSKVRSAAARTESPGVSNKDESTSQKSPNGFQDRPAEEPITSAAKVSQDEVIIEKIPSQHSPSTSPETIKAKRGWTKDGPNSVFQKGSEASIKLTPHLTHARQQAINNIGTRYIPNGHKVTRNGLVDSIVNQYDSLVLKGNAVKPQETSLGNSTTRRKPPKLRQHQSPALGRSS